jgi:hypothetical protein
MRPCLLSIAVVSMAMVLMAMAAYGQQPSPYDNFCLYGCVPYVPSLTTPEISLQEVSPNPVGASNATAGLIAGATNSTLSQTQGATNWVYAAPLWYQGGGAPLMTPEVGLSPESMGLDDLREAMREVRREVRSREEGSREVLAREDHGPRPREAARGDWTYFNGPTVAAKGTPKAARTYNRDDVARQNDTNGVVKYEGKTEKI